MIRTVTYLLAGVLVTSTWIVKAEAQANGNPTGGNFAKEHPRRNEVNTRVDNQRARIDQGLKNGTVDKQQAQQLRANDRAIKQQERTDVRANGGSLTKKEQGQLNRELDRNSAQISQDKH